MTDDQDFALAGDAPRFSFLRADFRTHKVWEGQQLAELQETGMLLSIEVYCVACHYHWRAHQIDGSFQQDVTGSLMFTCPGCRAAEYLTLADLRRRLAGEPFQR